MNSVLNDIFRAVISLPFLCAVLLQCLILMNGGFDSELYRMSVPLVCTFPFSCAWVEEARSGFARLMLPRTSVFWYIAGKFTACILSGGLAECLAALIYCTKEHLPLPQNAPLIFLCGAFWAGIAALLGAATDSKYSAYGGAFVLCYFLVILHERYAQYCYYLNPFEWLSPQNTWMFGQDGTALFLLGMTVVTGLIYACILERRLSRG